MLYFAVAVLVVIIDQASKRIIWEYFKHSGGMDLIDGFLRISLSKNTGAIMGILSGSRVLLILITILSIVVLILFAFRMRFAPVRKRIFIGLIFGFSPDLYWALLVGCGGAALVGLVGILLRKMGRKSLLPFGSFLALGAIALLIAQMVP